MSIPSIWSMIWNNTAFHGLILWLFLTASLIELYQTLRYRQETQVIAAACGFLRQWQRDKTRMPTPRISAWISDYIALDHRQQPIQSHRGFILNYYPPILQQSLGSSLKFVPSLCTAIGILGTFYGIQTGLQGISFGITNSGDLLAAIQTLLMGMRTAFSSSLMGLGFGSAFTLLLFVTHSLRQSWRDRLRIQLDRLFTQEPTLTQTPQAIAVAVGSQITTELIPVLDKISTALETLSPSENLPPNSLEYSSLIQQLSQTMTTLSEDLNQVLMALRKQHQETGDRLETISQNLQDTLKINLQQAIRDRAQLEQQMLEQLHQRTLELLTQASSTFQQQSQTLETVGTETAKLMQSAKIELIGGLQEMNETLLTSNQTLENYLEQSTQTYQGQLQDFFSQTVQIMESQRRAFRQSTADVADTFDGVREALENSLEHRANLEKTLLEEWGKIVSQKKPKP